MRITYVVSTMVFWQRENNLSFEQDCQFLKSLGLGIELWPSIGGQDECRYERRNWARLAAATKGMAVSMRSRNDNPTLEQWAEQIECAKMLGANIVTDLPSLGIANGLQTNGTGFAGDVVQIADDSNVRLCLETGHLPAVRQIGEKFQTVQYCLDSGYANIDPQFSFRQYVDELAERVTHVHLTDNYGRIDDHEAPGLRGGIARQDWEHLLNALNKFDNDVIGSLEMCPCMPAVMIRKASEFMFDELKWPNQPEKQRSYARINYNPRQHNR